MYAYFVRSTYDERRGMQSIKLESGQHWPTFEPGTAAILVHPALDYHAIRGDLFLRNKLAILAKLKPDEKVTSSGVFILAHNYKMALELLSP